MLCKGSPELEKSEGKGSPELGACGRGTLCMCQETCLSAVPSAGKGSPKLEASDRGKQAVRQEIRLSAAPIVRRGRSAPAKLELNNLNSILSRSAVTPVFPAATDFVHSKV